MTKRVAIRNHTAEANLFARRAFIALLGVIVLLVILFSNVYHLEVTSYEKYQTRSNSNRIKLNITLVLDLSSRRFNSD